MFGRGTCNEICEGAGLNCKDMSGVDALDRDSCSELALNGTYTTAVTIHGSPISWSEDRKESDSNRAALGWDDSNSGQSACCVETNGRLWYLENKDKDDTWISDCDAPDWNQSNNQFCSCISGKKNYGSLGMD